MLTHKGIIMPLLNIIYFLIALIVSSLKLFSLYLVSIKEFNNNS